MNEQRIVCWFSCGAASAVATKMAIEINNASKNPQELVVACMYIEDEHPDNARFFQECEDWFGQKIIELRSEKYSASVDKVIEKTRYMRGPNGARCTKELKKQVRLDWQRFNDLHVFGMTVDEQHRIDKLIDSENNIELWPVLIDNEISKVDCFERLTQAGIELPMMYKLGYNNNNCIGCLKAEGAGYWNKIRQDFPEVYQKRSRQEQLLGVSLIEMSANKFINEHPVEFKQMFDDAQEGKHKIKIRSNGAMRIPLRYLPETAGKHESILVGDCGFFCESKTK